VEVHPREVFVSAIRHRAAAIVCAHNHPSADPSPSAADIALTERLVATGELVGIPILDHLVISADGRFVAFSEVGLLRAAKLS
jgi:DNA repair protein RadC